VLDIIGKRRWFFLFSGIIVVPGLFFILLGPITGGKAGLQFSIDYTGGTQWEIRFKDLTVTPAKVKDVIAAQGFESQVQKAGDYLLVKTVPLGLIAGPTTTPAPSASPASSGSPAPSGSPVPSAAASPAASASPTVSTSPAASASAAAAASASAAAASASAAAASASLATSASPAASASAAAAAAASASPAASPSPSPSPSPTPIPGGVTRSGEVGTLVTALEAALGPIDAQRSLTTVGPVIGAELTQQAILLVLIGSLGILAWMTFRFRDFRFGMTALAALVHDVIVVVGIFAILGTFLKTEVDGLFVTAMLTIIGFSVHDTIVVYDRIRENRARHAGENFSSIVNHSILQTLARSINTSLTVVFTLTALLLFAGSSIQTFILALLIGITSGTYSSIFNAAPLLTVWEEWEERRRVAASGRPVRRAGT
jgi:preprotein translocase SecF subunit